MVRVVSGAEEQSLPLAGWTIGEVKQSLRHVLNITYFSDPYLDGHIVSIDDKLSAGNTLEFIFPYGIKSGDGQPPYVSQLAEALIAANLELQEIAKKVKAERLLPDQSIDLTLRLVTDHFIKKYGHPNERDQSTLFEVARKLVLSDLISLAEAAKMDNIYPQNAKRKAEKHNLLQIIGGHPVVSRSEWCKLIGLDPNQPQGAHPRTKTKPLPNDWDIDDIIEEHFDCYPSKHFSAKELYAAVKEKFPHVEMDLFIRILKEGQQRGDFDEDAGGQWFRVEPE